MVRKGWLTIALVIAASLIGASALAQIGSCRDEMMPTMIDIAKQMITETGGAVDLTYADVDTMSAGQAKAYTGTLVAGQVYGACVAATSGKDVDIYVYDSQGNLLDKGETNKPFDFVVLKPTHTGTYHYIVKMASGTGCYGFMVFERE